MSQNAHLTYVAKGLRSLSCLLYGIKHILALYVRKLLVNALAYGVLRYDVTLFSHCGYQWHLMIDTILQDNLKNVATYLNSENIFKFFELANVSSLFVHTVVRKHYWCSSFLLSRPLRLKAPS